MKTLLPLPLLFLFATLGVVETAMSQPSWEVPNHTFDSAVDELHFTTSGQLLAAAGFSGLYRSADSAATWQKVLDENVYDIREHDGRLFVSSLSGLLVSDDEGGSWETLMPAGARSLAVDGDTIVVGGTGGQLYYSVDTGTSWSVRSCELMPQGYDGSVHAAAVTSSAMVFTHGFDQAFASNDTGHTWSVVDAAYSFYVVSGGTIYASDGEDIVRSTNGTNWAIHAETPYFSLDDLAVDGDNLAVASFSGLAVSANAGQSWSDWSAGLEDEAANAVLIDSEGYVYAGTDCCVRRSSQPIGSSTNVSSSSPPEVPDTQLLESIYPNPSNSVVTIPFVIAESGHAQIEVYDAAGRRVATVLDSTVPAGRHKVDWSTSLPAGTYFVRLRAEGGSSANPLTISR